MQRQTVDLQTDGRGGLHRREWLRGVSALAAGLWLVPAADARRENEFPITGQRQPALAPLDELMNSFIREHDVPGAALAVTRDGRLVYARGFGYADVERRSAVEPAALFRIASVSKPLTAVAVMQLVERGKLKLDQPILPQMVPPRLSLDDHRVEAGWSKITLRHCLQHTGGWDRELSFDPIASPRKIAKSTGKTPISPREIIDYMMRHPLDFAPGERYAYSNLGYLLLGRAIEQAAGQDYQSYVRKHVWSPLGIRSARLGRVRLPDRVASEVRYYDMDNRTGPSLYPPDRGSQVPLPYGAENFEAFQAHGGWIASAVNLVKFAAAFDDPAECPLLSSESIAEMWSRPAGAAGHADDGSALPAYYSCGWSVRPVGDKGKANIWHTGLIAGSEALLVRRHDGFNWAVLFNSAETAGVSLVNRLDPLLHRAVGSVSTWPHDCQFTQFKE